MKSCVMEGNKQARLHISAESEYRTMNNLTSELVCIRDILIEISFIHKTPMSLYCNNQSAIYIAQNVLDERTKYIGAVM